ncbi:MAG: type II toxin-antitoxin system RelE/ParE family toxin [Bryobacteraceae bacterium]
MPNLAYNGSGAGKAATTAQVSLVGRLARSDGAFPARRSTEARFWVVPGADRPEARKRKDVAWLCGTAWQVRADDRGGTYRAVYVAQLGEAIYLLHAFQKKATSGIATPQRELDLIRQRLQLARKLAGK